MDHLFVNDEPLDLIEFNFSLSKNREGRIIPEGWFGCYCSTEQFERIEKFINFDDISAVRIRFCDQELLFNGCLIWWDSSACEVGLVAHRFRFCIIVGG